MDLDLTTVTLMTAVVVNVSGIVFMIETLVRRDEGAGRYWAIGFISAMMTTYAYLVWSYAREDAMWFVAVGNATFVASTGFIWLGCRRFNGRAMPIAIAAVLTAVAGAFVAVLLEGPDGGDWAGAVVMFAALSVVAALGAVESLRGEMGATRSSYALTLVLALQSIYLAMRTAVFVVQGAESEVFRQWFGTITVSFITVSLTIVALVVTSVLRAGRAQARGRILAYDADMTPDGAAPRGAFDRMLRELVHRASAKQEIAGVISVHIEDLDEIATAFGGEIAAGVVRACREGARQYAPTTSFIGEDGQEGILVGIQPCSENEARRQGALIYRGLFAGLGAVTGGVIPVVGVGVGLSTDGGYDGDALVALARSAAQQAATSLESSVVVGAI